MVASGRGEIFAGELGDSSGSIKFIAFSGVTINCKELDESIELGEVVNVKGVKNTHEGFPQIVVSSRDGSSMRVADPEEYDLSNFVPQSNQDTGLIWSYITGLLDSVQDPFIKTLVTSFTTDADLMRKFKTFYGARLFHHSCVGGLLEHTWEVLQYCELACRIHPSLNRDLVYAGAFLHDIGVLRENLEPLGMSESKEGFMMGHVYLSSEVVSNRISLIPGFPELTRTKLMNLILSHHDRKEPDVIEFPRTPEAVVVACADIFGSKVSQYVRAKKDSAGGTWKVQRAPIGWMFVE
jgi:3'-5' exoribonuclease